MCGNACETRFAVVDDLEAEIASRGRPPFVLTLNEVCRGQYDRLLANLPYHGHFQPTLRNRCWDGSDYGVAVLVRSSEVAYAGSARLPAPAGGEPRTVTCVRTAVQGRSLVACATHLDTDPAEHGQPGRGRRRARRRVPGRRRGDRRRRLQHHPGPAALHPMDAGFVEADAADDAFTGGCSRARCGDGPGVRAPDPQDRLRVPLPRRLHRRLGPGVLGGALGPHAAVGHRHARPGTLTSTAGVPGPLRSWSSGGQLGRLVSDVRIELPTPDPGEDAAWSRSTAVRS